MWKQVAILSVIQGSINLIYALVISGAPNQNTTSNN